MILKKCFLSLASLVLSTSALSENFSYTYLGVDLGKASTEEGLYVGGLIFDELLYASLHGSRRFFDHFVLSIETSGLSNEDRDIEILYSYAEFIASFPVSFGSNMDLIPFVGYRSDEAEVCLSNTCLASHNYSTEYGAKLRTWLIPDHLELNVKYLDADDEEFQSEFSFGVALMLNPNNRLNISHRVDDTFDVTSVGYRYQW